MLANRLCQKKAMLLPGRVRQKKAMRLHGRVRQQAGSYKAVPAAKGPDCRNSAVGARLPANSGGSGWCCVEGDDFSRASALLPGFAVAWCCAVVTKTLLLTRTEANCRSRLAGEPALQATAMRLNGRGRCRSELARECMVPVALIAPDPPQFADKLAPTDHGLLLSPHAPIKPSARSTSAHGRWRGAGHGPSGPRRRF